MHRICPSAQPHHVNSLAPVLRFGKIDSPPSGEKVLSEEHTVLLCAVHQMLAIS